MKDELINFETAKLAKEKGFSFTSNNQCYNDGGFICDTGLEDNDINLYYDIPAPTKSLLQRWLREVHNIEVLPTTYRKTKGKYDCIIITSLNEFSVMTETRHGWFNNYEEALEHGLIEALKLINNETRN